jgi:hypothetical protein
MASSIMNRPLVCAVVLGLHLASSGWAAAPEAQVRATFERYAKALRGHDGTAAARELDSNTVAYYASLRTAALSAPDVHGLPAPDRILVLRMRLELTPDQLSSFDGRALAAHAIHERWAGEPLAGISLGAIKIDGTDARAELVLNGHPRSAPLVFHLEKAGWKIDLTTDHERLNASFAALAHGAHLSEDELILKMLKETRGGQSVPDRAWRPLIPPPRR